MQETLSTGLKTTLNEKETNNIYNSIMRKIKFTNKQMNNTKRVVMVGKVGECVFAVCQNVKETNEAIRWCNTHKLGDKFDCEDYSMEIVEC